MNLFLNNKKISLKIALKRKDKIKNLWQYKKLKGLYIPFSNKINTYFRNNNIDILFLNNKNAILYIYQNIIPNKIINVNEDKYNTNILILPPNSSENLKIGDILTFEFEDII